MKINKIYLGDCLEVMQGIESGSVDMVLCDLPYGTTQNKWDSIIDLQLLKRQYLRIIKDNGAIVLTAAQPFTTVLISAFIEIFRYDIVWNKINSVGHLNANRMPLRVHETICIFYKKLPVYNPQKSYSGKVYAAKGKTKDNVGGFNYGKAASVDNRLLNSGFLYPTSILSFVKDANSIVVHPTQKPISLFEYLIKTYTNKGELILDNCIGSGTTAIACMNTGRNFMGIEKEQKYFDIANKRIMDKLK